MSCPFCDAHETFTNEEGYCCRAAADNDVLQSEETIERDEALFAFAVAVGLINPNTV